MIRIVSDSADSNSSFDKVFWNGSRKQIKSWTESLKTYLRVGHFTYNFTFTLTNPNLRLLHRLWQGAGKISDYSVTTEMQSKTTHIHSVVKLWHSEAQAWVYSPFLNRIRQTNKQTKLKTKLKEGHNNFYIRNAQIKLNILGEEKTYVHRQLMKPSSPWVHWCTLLREHFVIKLVLMKVYLGSRCQLQTAQHCWQHPQPVKKNSHKC